MTASRRQSDQRDAHDPLGCLAYFRPAPRCLLYPRNAHCLRCDKGPLASLHQPLEPFERFPVDDPFPAETRYREDMLRGERPGLPPVTKWAHPFRPYTSDVRKVPPKRAGVRLSERGAGPA